MKDPIFCRTKHVYESYTDFWTLVEVSGFISCDIDDIDWFSDDVYIVTPLNGEWMNIEKPAGATSRLVWWNMERPDANDVPLAAALDKVPAAVDAFWSSCKYVCSLDPRFQYVVFGSDERLNPWHYHKSEKNITYDFTHQSYAWGRRAALYERLKRSGYREGPSSFGSMRTAILHRSRVMLNLQQYPAPVFPSLRAALAAAFKLPLLSESIWDPYPLEVGNSVVMGPIDTLPMHLQLMTDEVCEKLAYKLHQKLCVEWTFRRGVEEGIKAMPYEKKAQEALKILGT